MTVVSKTYFSGGF